MPKNPPWWDNIEPNWKATLQRVPPWRQQFFSAEGDETRTLHVYDGPQLRWYIPPGDTVFEHGTGRPVANINEAAALCWIDGNHMHHASGKAFCITV
jgi:hypothetical protein